VFSSPSGVVYSPKHDTLVISLTDGSFHVIHNISSSPTTELPLDLEKQPSFSSSDLSSISRRVFVQVEGGAIPHAELNRINGMVSFGGFPLVTWAHEYVSLWTEHQPQPYLLTVSVPQADHVI
jgi:hypothetical protein